MSRPYRHTTLRQSTLTVLVAVCAIALWSGGCGDDAGEAPPSSAVVSNPAREGCRHPRPDRSGFRSDRACRELAAQVALGPRPSGSPAARRLAARLAGQMRQAGLRDVAIQRPWRNVVATLPGRAPGAVVVGAHYDTKEGIPGFVGANDGASGAAVVAELVRSLPRPWRGPTINVVFFDAEEARGNRDFEDDGTRGSRQYVALAHRSGAAAERTPALGSIDAMVLADMVGDCELAIPREANSDAGLYRRLGDRPPFGDATDPILDDHIPFVRAGIPAVDLIDFDYGPGHSPGAWWHTDRDTLDHVCQPSLEAVGEALRRALPRLPGAR